MQNLNSQYPMMYNNPMMDNNAFQPNNNFVPSDNFLPPNNFPPSGNFFQPGNFLPPNNQAFNLQPQFQGNISPDFSQPAQLPIPGNPIPNANLAPVTPQLTSSPENNNANQVVIAKNIITAIQGNLPPHMQDNLPTIMNMLDNLLIQLTQQSPQNVDDINQLQQTIYIIKDIRKELPSNMQDSLSMIMNFLDNRSKQPPPANQSNINASQLNNQTVSTCTCICPQHGTQPKAETISADPIPKDIRICQKQALILPGDKEYIIIEKANSPTENNYSQQKMWLLPKRPYMIFSIPSSEEQANQKLTANAMLYNSPPLMPPVQLPVPISINN